jgi:hypothetical protein
MVENVLNPKEFKRQGNQKNVIGRIAALYDFESATHEDPQRVEKLPEQSGAVFIHVPESTVAFSGHGVPEDVDALQYLVSLFGALASWR